MEFEPKVFRTLIFVRHGQYSSKPEKLTSLGRKQAQLTAKAIALLKPTKLYCSTMPRAIETATIFGQHVDLKFKKNDMFREGLLPGTIEFNKLKTKRMTAIEKRKSLGKMKSARKNADLAFKTLFKIPQKSQSTEIVVAHGNVIRHWVCRALDIPREKWLKMDISHASLTTVRISKKGDIVLLGLADTGHLPLKMRTYI